MNEKTLLKINLAHAGHFDVIERMEDDGIEPFRWTWLIKDSLGEVFRPALWLVLIIALWRAAINA